MTSAARPYPQIVTAYKTYQAYQFLVAVHKSTFPQDGWLIGKPVRLRTQMHITATPSPAKPLLAKLSINS